MVSLCHAIGYKALMSVSFDQLKSDHLWREIANCPGRYILRGGPTRTTLQELVGPEIRVEKLESKTARDTVWVAFIASGGMISYEKKDGRFIHTLNTASGFQRKREQLGEEAGS